MHLYWKLDQDILVEEIEYYNQILMNMFEGGDSCWDRTHFFRNPGTVNPKSGRLCELIGINDLVWSLDDLMQLAAGIDDRLRPSKREVRSRDALSTDDSDRIQTAKAIGGWCEPEELERENLKAVFQRYLEEQPTKDVFKRRSHKPVWYGRYKSRSHIEQAIVYALTGKGFGASDRQIIELADRCFAKHREEREKTGIRYITRTINAARRQHYENGWITSPEGGWPKARDAKYRWTTGEDEEKAIALAHGQKRSEWIKGVQSMLGFKTATAYRILTRLIDCGELRLTEDGRIFSNAAEEVHALY